MKSLRNIFGAHADVILVAFMVAILVVLFTPIPSQLLDFLLITNFGFGLCLLLLTFYMGKPLEFSTFPSLLLIATLFRLSLNIAATRLILSDADAGRVIGAIGDYVIGGNYVIGLIVFLVLIVVQYVVVTNGAQRVAEVAARFTLDSMPGKQLSIDADLNIGLIDEDEARRRRREIEKESSFYGAMDGASKFVKGDAIAGIIIILIDIIGGLTVGIAQMQMSLGEAAQTFTLLTVGDGIVTQIPALVIATATGIIVTRAGSDGDLSKEISEQITSYPKTLILVVIGLLMFLFLPGMPAWPIVILVTCLSLLVAYILRKRSLSHSDTAKESDEDAQPERDDVYGLLTIEPIEISVGHDVQGMLGTENAALLDRISALRKQLALEYGFVIPKVRVHERARLKPNSYEIDIYGGRAADGSIYPAKVLAINPGSSKTELKGEPTNDPTYGLPATWIDQDQRSSAKRAGFTLVEPIIVLTTHLSEVLKREAPNLLTRAETERLMERIRTTNAGLVDELVPNVLTLTEVQKVLQGLLHEKVSIRNLEVILEVLVDAAKANKNTSALIEQVRQRIGVSICQRLKASDDTLHVLTLDPALENTMAKSMRTVNDAATLLLEPRVAEQVITKLSAQVERMLNSSYLPVLLTAPELRAHLKKFTERMLPHLNVISISEVPNSTPVKAFGMVSL